MSFKNTLKNFINKYYYNKTEVDSIASSLSDDIQSLSGLSSVQIVSTRPTASADTTNKLYIVVSNNTADAYYTIQNGSNYSWKLLDEDILNNITSTVDFVVTYTDGTSETLTLVQKSN